VILFALFAATFLAVNRDAYRSYFQDDELDNLSWTRYAPATEYLLDTLTPKFFENNFRPVGHFYFHLTGNLFGLDYPKYVAVIQAFHLLNAWMVWLLARRLGAAPMAAAAACVFFGLHMALFDAFWKPMFVFDVLCATFCLLSLLFYAQGRLVLSFVAFWLAYKSKELAVMLPVALAMYEFWFGKRRWIRLTPFFLTSLSFGVQGLLLNPNQDNDYTFRYTWAALAKTSAYYAGKVFLVPYLGFILPLAALLARNKRAWFGLAMMGAFLFPMLFLPGRMLGAYCYLPFTGLAIAMAGLAEAASPAAVVLFFLLWLPQDIHWLRLQRRDTLARAAEVREWVTTVERFAATDPSVNTFVYSGTPGGFPRWGVEGALKYLFHRLDIQLQSKDEARGEATPPGRAALLEWDPVRRKLEITALR
jgi:hypothetical protein